MNINTLNFKKKTDENNKELEIYLGDKKIEGFAEMLNIILKNRNAKFVFNSFSALELRGIKILMINYSKYLNSLFNKKLEIIVTHTLRYHDKRHFYLLETEEESRNSLDYLELSDFETIDKIDFISFNPEFNLLEAIVEGTVCL